MYMKYKHIVDVLNQSKLLTDFKNVFWNRCNRFCSISPRFYLANGRGDMKLPENIFQKCRIFERINDGDANKNAGNVEHNAGNERQQISDCK